MQVKGLYTPTLEDRATYKDMSVVVLVPCKDNEVPIKFTKCLVNMIAYSWLHGLKVYQMGCTERMVIHWARNDLCKQTKDKINEYTGERFTHIMWLDDDQVFNPDMLVYLARHGDKDAVSALYFGRAGRHLPVAYVKDTSEDKYKHFPLIEVPTALCEVDAVGFGALLMRIDLLDRVKEPWFSFNNNAGEDINFCVHAKEHGARIFLDGSYRIGHIGDCGIVTESTYLQYLEDNKEEFAEKTKVALGGKRHV